MKFISLFAGIGGLDLGLERAGMECVAQVEIDEFCQKVLTKHWPSVPKFKDVRDVGNHNLPPAELICGGFPCQDVSLAGLRKGLEGERSTLWSEFYRIVCEIQPRWIVIENVLGLLSSDDGEFFTKILRDISEIGFNAEWQVIPASAFGAFHKRDRVLIVAYAESVRLSKVSVFGKHSEKSSIEKPNEWEFFQSIPGGAYQIDERWKERQDRVCRNDDGVPGQLDEYRIKSLGNAVVPQVAEFIGNSVMKVEACLTNA